MTEEFLHYIWKYKLLKPNVLKLTTGEKLEIIKPGEHNSHAGPDFFNARLKIDNTIWAGNVEIHTKASSWNEHNHSNDKAYSNIILHVVFNDDKIILGNTGKSLPTFILKNNFDESIYKKYVQFKNSKEWIPCEKQLSSVDSFTVSAWLERILIQRLERKTSEIINNLEQNKHNWDETFYQTLAKSFGFKVNSQPMEMLARATPASVVYKHKDQPFQIEALLFGQAGLLTKKFNDQYPTELQKEYSFLQQKYSLQTMPSHLWKFLRLRPANFPTIRLAQLSALLYKTDKLFSTVLECDSISTLKNLLQVEANHYWLNHYTFDKISQDKDKKKKLGDEAVNTIIINTIVPFLFVYGKQRNIQAFCDKALHWLEELEPENNIIIKKWKALGLSCKSSFHSQALIELRNEYCHNKQCLNCGIGNNLLKIS